EVNGWWQLDFQMPRNGLTGKPITAIGIRFWNAIEDFSFSLGKLALLDSAHMPPTPQNLPLQPDPAGMFDWSKEYRSGSHYRIWGEYDENKEKYLLGVAYNSVYSTYKNVFNTNEKNFTRYIVQEVNSAGIATPL